MTLILARRSVAAAFLYPKSGNTMKNAFKYLLLCALWMPFTVKAQTDRALLADLAEENKASVEALVLYPSETRLAILEATKYPEVLIKMQNMRDKTSAAFRTLIEDFPRSTQTVFYDVSRYSGLTELLVSQQNDPAAIRKSLEVMPPDKQEETFGVVTRQMPTLIQINQLNLTADRAFDRLIQGYPEKAQLAFDRLLGLPEVIDLLNEDLRFTVLVGETYRDYPAWVIHKTDSLNLAVARAHAEELDQWKSTLEQDPQAKAELQSAAQDYAAENGYDTYEYEDDDLYTEGGHYQYDHDFAIHHYDDPYLYWYGYPWWEPYPRWRPYPWWYDWGCYYYPGGVIIYFLPSYHFTHWYFDNPHHHVHYNHLSTDFVNHYYGHRHSGTAITTGVREWHNQNRAVISDEFIADKGRLPERLKEYGRFEEGRKEYNAKNPQRVLSQEDYLEKNAKKYPEIKQSRDEAKTEIQREDQVKREKRANWAPAKAPTTPEPEAAPRVPRQEPVSKPPVEPKRQPTPVPKTEQPPRVPTPPAQRPDRPSVPKPAPKTQPDEAKDYNRQKWEPPSPPKTRPNNPAPAPKVQKQAPPKTPKTKGRN